MAKVVVAGLPHHVAQRGNRRQDVLFFDKDRIEHLEAARESAERFERDTAWIGHRGHLSDARQAETRG